MSTQLSLLLRRTLALALLVVPGALFAGLTVRPAMTRLADLEAQIEQERVLAGRLAGLADEPAGTAPVPSAAKARGLFIEGTSDATRFAALQSHVSALATRSGLKLRSSRNLPPKDKADLRLIGVQVQLLAPVDKLQSFMLQVEQHKPALMIWVMQVAPSSVARLPGQESAGLLDARLDIVAMEAR